MILKGDYTMKNVWIWGIRTAGHYLGFVAFDVVTAANGWTIRGIIDNSLCIAGLSYRGIQIKAFDAVRNEIEVDDLVICCCKYAAYPMLAGQLEKIGHKNHIHFSEFDFSDHIFNVAKPVERGYDGRIVSRCCSQRDFEQNWFREIAAELNEDIQTRYHRKTWEWVYILKALKDSGMLESGKKGIGFAVGEEPLPSYLAGKGIDVLATDLSPEDVGSKEWIATGQNAQGSLDCLFRRDLCTREQFENVSYRDVNMNEIPEDIGLFDFCWSSCAIEHVGSLKKSKDFLKNMLRVLKPGGIAVHTTEYNLSSNDETVEYGNSILWRKRDVEEMQQYFLSQGCFMEVSFLKSDTDMDMHIAIPPYTANSFDVKSHHLALVIEKYISTSMAIIVKKP